MSTHLQKIAVKFFVENPSVVRLPEIVPIFHRWIQTRRLPGILVDVADYGHLENGPGVILVGHEADYFLDSMEGPLGLLYSRKLPLEGGLGDRIRDCLRAVLLACRRLEEEPAFEGMLRFKGGEALFIANDRLAAPNTPKAFEALRPELERALAPVYPGAKVELALDTRDPRGRLTVHVRSSQAADVASLLARLT